MTLNHTGQQPTANKNNRYGEAGKCPVSLWWFQHKWLGYGEGTCFTTLQIGTLKRCRVPWNVVDKQLTYTWNASVFPNRQTRGRQGGTFFCLFLGNTKLKCGSCWWRTPAERDNKSLIVYFLHLTALSVINNQENWKAWKLPNSVN